MNSSPRSLFSKEYFSLAFLSLLIMAISSCQPKRAINPHSINIEGRIQYPLGDKIYFSSYADSSDLFLENKTRLDSAIPDKNGSFSFTFRSERPMVFDLESAAQNLATNLILCPGDLLKINFKGKNFSPEIESSTEEGKINLFLVNFLDSFYRSPDIKQEYYISTNYMDGESFATYNERREKAQLEYFKDFFRNDSLKKEYRDYALNTIHYGIAVDRLMYVWKKRMKNETVLLPENYFAFETKSFIENAEAFYCPAYIRFLHLYIKDTFDRMVEQGELPLNKTIPFLPQVEKYKLAASLLSRPFRDVVLYSIIMSDMHDVNNSMISKRDSSVPLDSMIAIFRNKYSL